MIAFEIAKNRKLLGTVEAGTQGLLMAMAQWLRSVDEQGASRECGCLSAAFMDSDNEETSKFVDHLDVDDIVSIRVIDTDKNDPRGWGVPSVRHPPELPPGRKLFSN